MTTSKSIFERDRAIAWDRYPKEMQRLETLRSGFDYDFDAAFRLAREEGQLIAWTHGSHILAYHPGDSPVGLHLRCDAATKQITDLGMVGKLNCPRLVEVHYERHDQTQTRPEPDVRPRADCQGEQTPRQEATSNDCSGWWGINARYGDPPRPPPGAIPLPRERRGVFI